MFQLPSFNSEQQLSEAKTKLPRNQLKEKHLFISRELDENIDMTKYEARQLA